MQLRHGDNLGKGFCTSTSAYKCDVCTSACAKPFPKIVPMAKLHSLIVTLIKKIYVIKICQIASFMSKWVNDTIWFHLPIVDYYIMQFNDFFVIGSKAFFPMATLLIPLLENEEYQWRNHPDSTLTEWMTIEVLDCSVIKTIEYNLINT